MLPCKQDTTLATTSDVATGTTKYPLQKLGREGQCGAPATVWTQHRRVRAGQTAVTMSAAPLLAANALVSWHARCTSSPPLAPSQVPARLGRAYQHSEGQGEAAARCEKGVLRVLVQLRGHPFHDDGQELQSSVAAPLDHQTICGHYVADIAEQVGDQASRDNQARLRPGQRSQRTVQSRRRVV